jgi:hypothetical protein
MLLLPPALTGGPGCLGSQQECIPDLFSSNYRTWPHSSESGTAPDESKCRLALRQSTRHGLDNPRPLECRRHRTAIPSGLPRSTPLAQVNLPPLTRLNRANADGKYPRVCLRASRRGLRNCTRPAGAPVRSRSPPPWPSQAAPPYVRQQRGHREPRRFHRPAPAAIAPCTASTSWAGEKGFTNTAATRQSRASVCSSSNGPLQSRPPSACRAQRHAPRQATPAAAGRVERSR